MQKIKNFDCQRFTVDLNKTKIKKIKFVKKTIPKEYTCKEKFYIHLRVAFLLFMAFLSYEVIRVFWLFYIIPSISN